MSHFLQTLKKPDYWLFLIGAVLLVAHLVSKPQDWRLLVPVTIKQFTLSMTFEGDRDDIRILTYLPKNTNRQTVFDTRFDGLLENRQEEKDGGLRGIWEGEEIQGLQRVTYRTNVIMQEMIYNIPEDLEIPRQLERGMKSYLSETDAIQVNHPEIVHLWQQIKPENDSNALAVIQAIYNFTDNELEGASYKGETDALTALRLRQASCNGKSRLFVALARLNKLPARLVGGIVLDNGQKRTSHQWVEVYLGNYWVPFDPTNHHFAKIPAHYMELYRGDHVLFTRTRNINFDWEFDIRTTEMANGVYAALSSPEKADRFNAGAILAVLGLDEQTASIFLLFPFGALCITFFRNVVGIKSFGTFMPMLVAAACRYTGLDLGLTTFAIILLIALLMHHWLGKARLLKIPRLAAVITTVTLLFLVVIGSFNLAESQMELGIISLFPVVIISFTADRLHRLVEDGSWGDIIKHLFGTIFLVCICYAAFSSLLLRGAFALFPELLILVLATQIYIGRWTGVRATEFWRFWRLIQHSGSHLLGMNERNRNIVMVKNTRQLIQVANDKMHSKALLKNLHITVAPTLARYDSQFDCQHLTDDLKELDRFVIKPNHGSRGQGILVVRDSTNTTGGEKIWIDAGGHLLTMEDIRRHVQDILSGKFSSDHQGDSAFIEPLLVQHQAIHHIAPFGLSDIRVILHDGLPIACMWRVPTTQSNGKANLHQGAVGVSIDLETGITTRAKGKSDIIEKHPDTDQPLVGIQMPFWPEIIAMAQNCYRAVPLGYLGVDICIDQEHGPLVLEINARPGLEIQNIKDLGIRGLISQWSNKLKLNSPQQM